MRLGCCHSSYLKKCLSINNFSAMCASIGDGGYTICTLRKKYPCTLKWRKAKVASEVKVQKMFTCVKVTLLKQTFSPRKLFNKLLKHYNKPVFQQDWICLNFDSSDLESKYFFLFKLGKLFLEWICKWLIKFSKLQLNKASAWFLLGDLVILFLL